MNVRSFDVRILGALVALCPLVAGCSDTSGDYGRGAGPASPGAAASNGIAAEDTDGDDGGSSTGDADDPDDDVGSTGAGDEGSTGEQGEDTAPVDTLTFAGDVWPMFKARCSCHVDFPAGGLALSQGTAHVSIVGAQAEGAPDMVYVVPGDLDNSYLWRKLKGEQEQVGGDGVMMPQAGIPLIDEELELVEQWILEGAVP